MQKITTFRKQNYVKPTISVVAMSVASILAGSPEVPAAGKEAEAKVGNGNNALNVTASVTTGEQFVVSSKGYDMWEEIDE